MRFRPETAVRRRPLVLHLYTHAETYGEFSHRPDTKFYNFKDIHDEIQRETDRVAGSNKAPTPACSACLRRWRSNPFV